eukprot:EG_transcript_17664
MASALKAYLLWLSTGLLGSHHVYLKRDYHAFLWWTTGGFFGLGWLRDCWRLPTYVAEHNGDPYYREILKTKIQYEEAPSLVHSYGIPRLLAQFFFGGFYYLILKQGCYVLLTDPEHGLPAAGVHLPAIMPHLAGSSGMVAGIWLAGSTNRHIASDFRWLMSGCILGYVLNDILGQLFLGVLFFYWRRAWVLKPRPPPPAYVRFCGLTAGGLLYLFYWALIFFFLEFTVNNEGAQPQKVRVRDAIIHAWQSRFWLRAWSEFRDTYHRKGWEGILAWLDLTGETHAREVLGVSKDAGAKEIKSAFRKLAREWHPDRNPDPAAKKKMEELNEAHQLLMRIVPQ